MSSISQTGNMTGSQSRSARNAKHAPAFLFEELKARARTVSTTTQLIRCDTSMR